MICRRNYSKISKQRQNETYWTFSNIHGNVHGLPPHLYYREDPTKAVPRQSLRAMLFNTQHFTGLTEEHCSQPCRIPTKHGKYAIFPRETFPAGKREIHIARHRKHAIFPRELVPARKGEIHIGDQTEAIHGYMYIYTGD